MLRACCNPHVDGSLVPVLYVFTAVKYVEWIVSTKLWLGLVRHVLPMLQSSFFLYRTFICSVTILSRFACKAPRHVYLSHDQRNAYILQESFLPIIVCFLHRTITYQYCLTTLSRFAWKAPRDGCLFITWWAKCLHPTGISLRCALAGNFPQMCPHSN